MFANLAMLLEQFSSNTTTSSVNKNINAPCRVAYRSNQGNLIFRGGIRTYCVHCVQLSQHFCWRVWFNNYSEFSLYPTITITVMARRSETELKIRLNCDHFNLKIIFTQNTLLVMANVEGLILYWVNFLSEATKKKGQYHCTICYCNLMMTPMWTMNHKLLYVHSCWLDHCHTRNNMKQDSLGKQLWNSHQHYGKQEDLYTLILNRFGLVVPFLLPNEPSSA